MNIKKYIVLFSVISCSAPNNSNEIETITSTEMRQFVDSINAILGESVTCKEYKVCDQVYTEKGGENVLKGLGSEEIYQKYLHAVECRMVGLWPKTGQNTYKMPAKDYVYNHPQKVLFPHLGRDSEETSRRFITFWEEYFGLGSGSLLISREKPKLELGFLYTVFLIIYSVKNIQL